MFKPSQLHKLTVAFMGNFCFEKGSHVFAQLVELCSKQSLPINWWILGGIGDEKSFQKAQMLAQVKTTGFYATDELPELLNSRHVDLGLILSIFPESYSKLSRECWQQELPLIFNRIGVLDHLAFSDFGIKNLPEHLPLVIQKLEKICEDPNLLTKEKKKIQTALRTQNIISANQKHLSYLKLYTQK